MKSTSGTDVIVVPHSGGGFFSNFNKAMSYFVINEHGRVFVDWTLPTPVPHFPYGRAEDGNVWDAFFETLPPVSPGAVVAYEYPHDQGLLTGIDAYILYKRSKWRSVYHEAFKRHVRVKPNLTTRTDRLLSGANDHFKIGVHYRHAGHNCEAPFPVESVENVVRRVRRIARNHALWSVVLATDVVTTATYFKQEFADRLIIQDHVGRANGDEQFHETTSDPSTANGEAILVDALLLSRCNILLHVTSNVATAVGYINPNVKFIYLETISQKIRATVKWHVRAARMWFSHQLGKTEAGRVLIRIKRNLITS